jgi:hypothetical protein
MTTPRDFLLDEGDEGDDATDDSADTSESESEGDPKSTDKRVRDLQSKADKETARANKAEAQLARLLAAAKAPESEGSGTPAPAGGNVADTAILDMARMFAYQQHPKLAEYGLTTADLTGSTPSEVAETAVALVARFEKIETRVRNKVLADNGMAPEIDGGAPPAKPRDFSKMPKADFDKLVEESMRGGVRS